MMTIIGQSNGHEDARAYVENPYGGLDDYRTQEAVVMVFGFAVLLCAFGVACGMPVGLQLGPLAMHIG